MKSSYQPLVYKNLAAYLAEHNGKLVTTSFTSYQKVYECDHNVLVVDDPKLKIASIYLDREAIYEEQRKIQKWNKFNPLKDKQELLQDIEANKQKLLNVLFDSLQLKQPAILTEVNLSHLNKAIKQYGYENALDNLYLNIIIFMGEYIKEKKGGHWVAQLDLARPPQLMPVFIDKNGQDLGFSLNTLLVKNYHLKGNINIQRQLEFA